jgi:hypothetical protein
MKDKVNSIIEKKLFTEMRHKFIILNWLYTLFNQFN